MTITRSRRQKHKFYITLKFYIDRIFIKVVFTRTLRLQWTCISNTYFKSQFLHWLYFCQSFQEAVITHENTALTMNMYVYKTHILNHKFYIDCIFVKVLRNKNTVVTMNMYKYYFKHSKSRHKARILHKCLNIFRFYLDRDW